MYGKIKIGEKEVEMLATASTAFRFKGIFHTDLLSIMVKGDEGSVDDYERLAFVMAMQAEKKDLTKLTEEDFYVWLDDFDFTDLVEALPEVVNLYIRNTKSDSAPK